MSPLVLHAFKFSVILVIEFFLSRCSVLPADKTTLPLASIIKAGSSRWPGSSKRVSTSLLLNRTIELAARRTIKGTRKGGIEGIFISHMMRNPMTADVK